MLKYCESNGIFVRSLGLDVTAQTLDNLLKTNEAFKNLGVTSSKALLQSDKAMLRLIAVLQNAQNSFGDMQRTVNTLSNQIKVFQGSLSNLKLAIGDLFSEPFRQALVYINAFIIALTDIIRLFKPIKTASETAGAGMEQFADDTEDAVDASTGGGNLDFDEFRVLGDSDSQISITEAITTELQKQIDAYNEQLSAMNDVKNEAIEIAEKIKDWFVVLDEEGNFVDWTTQVKLLSSAIGILISIPIANWLLKLVDLTIKVSSSFNLMTKMSQLAASTGIFLIISSIVDLVANFDTLSTSAKIARFALIAVGAALVTFSILTKIALKDSTALTTAFKLQRAAAIGLAIGGIALLVTNVSNLIGNWDQLTSFEKVIGIFGAIGAAALAAAAAIAAFHGAWTLGTAVAAIAGGLLAITAAFATFKSANNIDGFANGGITDANFIMTHENGVREWVGKQGNSTAVVNDTQMSTVMSQSVRDGVLEAMSYGAGSNENINITVQAQLDGQKIYESTRRIARKNGEKFARV